MTQAIYLYLELFDLEFNPLRNKQFAKRFLRLGLGFFNGVEYKYLIYLAVDTNHDSVCFSLK